MVPFKIQLNILLLVLVQLFLASVNSLSQNQQFGKLTVEDGLSNSFVNCLLQDSFGFIWFGTDDGLNRFDGYDIKAMLSGLYSKIGRDFYGSEQRLVN